MSQGVPVLTPDALLHGNPPTPACCGGTPPPTPSPPSPHPKSYGSVGGGLLRLHSTYRHDLKIYSSDEGRVQMSAAAFVQVGGCRSGGEGAFCARARGLFKRAPVRVGPCDARPAPRAAFQPQLAPRKKEHGKTA